ncbi:PAS domain S-box-containing protein [Nitrospirillum amazonense]|uniref:histidine kinase n=1 Tax=Nitrospirillum amazonense TaxID=28077 RepID=A0A560JU68_9PROT|nr:ATP-binding protein [Nitrospirillum amazonense]TWB71850.1 PAS domain S-box-containing protein [Nitrospirillum amazonense]
MAWPETPPLPQFLTPLLQGLNDAVVIFNSTGQVCAINPAAEGLYGVAGADALGQPVDGILTAQDGTTREAIEGRLAACGSWRGELARRNAQGKALVVEACISRLDEGGTLFMDAARDLTAQHETIAALKLATARNTNLFEAMAVSFWDMDFQAAAAAVRQKAAEGITDMAAYFAANPEYVRWLQGQVRVVATNPRTLDMFRATSQADFADIARYWPDASLVHFTNGLLKGMRREASYISEVRLRRADGTEFDSLFSAAFPSETVPSGRVIVGVMDIDEQKRTLAELSRSENRYRTLFETTGVAFFRFDTSGINQIFATLRSQGVTDLDAHIRHHPDFLDLAKEQILCVDANASAVRLLGAASKADLLRDLRWIVTPDHLQGLRETLVMTFGGHYTYQSQRLIGRVDGSLVPCLWFTVAPPELRAQNTAFVGLIDISEQEAARAAEQAMQVELAHAARIGILGELTASLAHEVAQPLSAISSRGEAVRRWLSRDTVDVPVVQGLMGKIMDSVERAAGIVSRIRDMAIKAPFHVEPVDLAKLARDTVAFLSHELGRGRVAVRIDVADRPCSVEGDRVQLQQLLFNILLNAHQALEQGAIAHPAITVTLRGENDHIVVTIDDNGPGIPVEDLGRVFDSFRTTRSDGMGIGLSVCRSIVLRHGGNLSAGNLPAGGARFTIRLPVVAG